MDKVVIGMSGGVDSSVSALLLQRHGYDVIGVTMDCWEGELDDAAEAREITDILGIPHYVVDFKDVFREKVINRFIADYQNGRTPNPCIECNRYVKWEVLRQAAAKFGAKYVATGHYAQIGTMPNGRLAIRNSATAEKDQSYVLYRLTQEQLEGTLFPVGIYSKPEVRQMAMDAGLPAASKPDSEEICFVPGTDYAGYIQKKTGTEPEPGNFVTPDGTVLGRHKGIIHYTVGQRKGLQLAMGHRVFVKEIRPETNEIVIAEPEDLIASSVRIHDLAFMGSDSLTSVPGEAWRAKVNYNHRGCDCTVERVGEDEALVTFASPVRVVTPGQSVVLYQDGFVMGGGVI